MPTSKATLTSISLLEASASSSELPFVSKHARVASIFGHPKHSGVVFAAGDRVGVSSVWLNEEASEFVRPDASSRRVQYIPGPSVSSAIVHLSVDNNATRPQMYKSDSSFVAEALSDMVIERRTNVIAACADGSIMGLRSDRIAEQAAHRKPRTESSVPSSTDAAVSTGFSWEHLARWNSVEGDEAERWAQSPSHLLGNRGAAFCVARVGASPTAESTQLAASHESFREVRIFDLATGSVVHRLYTSHAPVALQCVHGAWSSSTPLFAVAEGPVASLWDPRQGAGSSACVSRMTLFDADVSDLAATSDLTSRNVMAVASSDRDVTLVDPRKWAKIAVEQNVLKYAPVGIASAGVCPTTAFFPSTILTVGIDSEVRAVDVNSSASTAAARKVKDAAATEASRGENGAPASGDANGGADEPLQGIFRQRLASAQHCRASWHGAPAQCTVGGKLWAVAMSTHGELFGVTAGIDAV